MPVTRLDPETVDIPLPHVRMWREDFQEIFEWLDTLTDAKLQIVVRADGKNYQLDSVDELAELNTRRIELIKIAEPRINVRVSFGIKSSITATDPSFQVRAVMEQVKQIAIKRQRLDVFLVPFGIFCSVFAAPGLALGAYPNVSGIFRPIVMVIVVLLIIWVVGAVVSRIRVPITGSMLYTGTRADNPSFLQRKRDDLFINGIALLVGGVIGYFINYIS